MENQFVLIYITLLWKPVTGINLFFYLNIYNILYLLTSNLLVVFFSRNLNDSSILLSSSRVLFVLSKRLCTNKDIHLEKHQLECFISYLWTRMDHFLDGVRHLARDTMINMVKIKGNLIHKYFIIKKIILFFCTC